MLLLPMQQNTWSIRLLRFNFWQTGWKCDIFQGSEGCWFYRLPRPTKTLVLLGHTHNVYTSFQII